MGCAQAQNVATQNDISDFLQKIIAILQRLAGFFDSLKADVGTQSLIAGPCEQALLDGFKAELAKLVVSLPAHVQSYVNCKLGFAPVAPVVQADAQFAGIGALLPYLPKLIQYLPQIIALIRQIEQLLKNGGGTGGIVNPVMPNAGYSPRDVQRC